MSKDVCPHCDGISAECDRCGGTGYVDEQPVAVVDHNEFTRAIILRWLRVRPRTCREIADKVVEAMNNTYDMTIDHILNDGPAPPFRAETPMPTMPDGEQ